MKLAPTTIFATAIFGIAMAHAQTTPPAGSMAQAPPPASSSGGSAKLSQSDHDFATKAAQAGLAEIAEAKIALQKSTRADVKSFAQRMIDDHTKAADQLQRIATSDGISLPSQPSVSDGGVATKLSGDTKANFDKDYIEAQRKAHKEAVSLFTRESQQGHDPALKAFAKQTLPTLQAHDRMVEAMSLSKEGA